MTSPDYVCIGIGLYSDLIPTVCNDLFRLYVEQQNKFIRRNMVVW